MSPYWIQRLDKLRNSRRGDVRSTPRALLLGLIASMTVRTAQADNFSSVYYDSGKDELVITMTYRGTNPDHTFSVKWGRCKDTPGRVPHEIVGEVLDSQWQDNAKSNFQKTVRFSVADVRCRPANVTLRTAPRFIYTLVIPAANAPQP